MSAIELEAVSVDAAGGRVVREVISSVARAEWVG